MQAPVTLGFTFGPNSQGMPKACSFAGFKGVCYSGVQFFCNVRSAAATTSPDVILKDVTVAGDVNGFYHQVYIRPGFGSSVGATNLQTGTIVGQDPLLTQLSVFRKYRFRKLGFYYVPKIGTSTTAQIALAWTPTVSALATNSSSSPADTNGTLEQYECSTSFPVWEYGFLDCSKYLMTDKLLFTNAQLCSTGFSNAAPDTFITPSHLCPGSLLATIDGSTAGSTYGRLMMMYEIECYYRGPKVTPDNTGTTVPDIDKKPDHSDAEAKVPEEKVHVEPERKEDQESDVDYHFPSRRDSVAATSVDRPATNPSVSREVPILSQPPLIRSVPRVDIPKGGLPR